MLALHEIEGAGTAAKSQLRGYVSLAGDLRAGKTTPRAFLEDCLERIART